MKMVGMTLDKLGEEIRTTLKQEEENEKLQKIIRERDFFREHAIFLNNQNEGLFISVDTTSQTAKTEVYLS